MAEAECACQCGTSHLTWYISEKLLVYIFANLNIAVFRQFANHKIKFLANNSGYTVLLVSTPLKHCLMFYEC